MLSSHGANMGLLHSVGDRGWAAEMRSGRPCTRRCGYVLGFVVDSDFVFNLSWGSFIFLVHLSCFPLIGVPQAQICFINLSINLYIYLFLCTFVLVYLVILSIQYKSMEPFTYVFRYLFFQSIIIPWHIYLFYWRRLPWQRCSSYFTVYSRSV